MAQLFNGVDYQGYSDENKPEKAKEGETYLEIDTCDVFTWHNNKWCKIGSPKEG